MLEKPVSQLEDVRNVYDSEGSKLLTILETKDEFSNEIVEAIFCKLAKPLHAAYLSNYPNLRYILCPTTGLDHIDLGYCTKNAISVISLKDELDTTTRFTSTCELALWLSIELNRNITSPIESVLKGSWNRDEHISRSLSDVTFGVLGYGRLGKTMTRILQSFYSKIIVFDIDEEKTRNLPEEIRVANSVTDLVRNVDILSIHVDDRIDNVKIIDASVLKEITSGTFILINTARGFILDESAVVDYLRNGIIKGFGADVLAGETSENLNWLQANPIWQLMQLGSHNIVLTPHIGGATFQNIRSAEELVFSKLIERCKK